MRCLHGPGAGEVSPKPAEADLTALALIRAIMAGDCCGADALLDGLGPGAAVAYRAAWFAAVTLRELGVDAGSIGGIQREALLL